MFSAYILHSSTAPPSSVLPLSSTYPTMGTLLIPLTMGTLLIPLTMGTLLIPLQNVPNSHSPLNSSNMKSYAVSEWVFDKMLC